MNTSQPISYPFIDYWAADEVAARQQRIKQSLLQPKVLGVTSAIDADVQEAENIIVRAPTTSLIDDFTYFADLTAVRGELQFCRN
jgi:hypothetical protein